MNARWFVRRLTRRLNPLAIVRRARQTAHLARQIRTHIDNRPSASPRAQPRTVTEFPRTATDLRRSPLLDLWWYYAVELLPGVMTKGLYPADIPMLPRIHLRECDLGGMSCLDMGTMEGIVPALMRRRGAKHVLAIDAIDGCAEKMEALKHYHDVDFDFQAVGLMYELYTKLPGQAFDLINCSGLLYHVYSPIHILSGLRPLLKRNGLLIVSTPIINDESYRMSFNNAGRIQQESNTFWYVAVNLLDYMLRYLQLAPIGALYYPFSIIRTDYKYEFDEPAGYLSVVCRAVDEIRPTADDHWMEKSARSSWERRGLGDWGLAHSQPRSTIAYRGRPDRELWRRETDSLNLWRAVNERPSLTTTSNPADTHLLRLTDDS